MRTRSWLVWIAGWGALLGVAGCASGGRTASFAPAPEGQANVIVYLSNQSVPRPSVALAVYVDGRLALRKELASVFQNAGPHGFPEEFPLRLAPGPHTIKVVAEGQVATASTEIVVGADTLHVDAAYYWSPGGKFGTRVPEKITLQVGTERPGFV